MKNHIGKKIRIERLKKGLSQENMAEAIGMSPGNYGKIERGEIAVNIDTLDKIAKVLEITVTYLISDHQTNESPSEYNHPVSRTEFLLLTDVVKQLSLSVHRMESVLEKFMAKTNKS